MIISNRSYELKCPTPNYFIISIRHCILKSPCSYSSSSSTRAKIRTLHRRHKDSRLQASWTEDGLKSVSLAFALGGLAGCSPTWGGQMAINDPMVINEVKAFKSAGGDVIVSHRSWRPAVAQPVIWPTLNLLDKTGCLFSVHVMQQKILIMLLLWNSGD